MTKPQGFLATFRIDEELWGKFKDIAKNKQTNASALIIQYIQGVVSSGGVDNVPQSTPQNIDNLPKLSIQDIEKIIDEKINSSIQAMDNNQSIQNHLDLNTISIQDIDNRIDEKINQSIQNHLDLNTISIQDIDNRIDDSLTDGKISEAIAKLTEGISTSYEAMMGQFNGLLEELQDLKSQLQELKLVPPAAVPSSQSPINDPSSAPINYQLPVEETGEDSDLIDSISTNDLLPMTTGEDKPTIMLHDGSILVVSEKQEKILILLGLIPQTHNILTSQFLGAVCKSNLANNKGELESLIKQEIDSKGSTIRKTAAILRSAGFMLSGSEGKGFLITGIK
ncbi:hypothetical protein IQ227_24985 [Anabaena aphanizomenioides LEGE 00250]|uniref:Uncharacterized protein n=1 Tax=Sphaerospermopsis aphanizomenoides LEGE 00250 TaxID=2777972 RepID=A0ABR9VP49_9CYAN|nr:MULTISPECIES: hypothetical protein [Nostocales]AFW97321.1 hypothetical protein ANA_P30016 [Anabaena sp. 90]MBE9239175.1 hypothetical protein [Sphaerospermopsis aphanizomenoides LEGE 00250]